MPGEFDGTTQILFKDNARGGWNDSRGWHGTFTENVVQAISRDLLAAAMLRLEAAGYPVVLHVHDEIVCEVPDRGWRSQQIPGAPNRIAGLGGRLAARRQSLERPTLRKNHSACSDASYGYRGRATKACQRREVA